MELASSSAFGLVFCVRELRCSRMFRSDSDVQQPGGGGGGTPI